MGKIILSLRNKNISRDKKIDFFINDLFVEILFFILILYYVVKIEISYN